MPWRRGGAISLLQSGTAPFAMATTGFAIVRWRESPTELVVVLNHAKWLGT